MPSFPTTLPWPTSLMSREQRVRAQIVQSQETIFCETHQVKFTTGSGLIGCAAERALQIFGPLIKKGLIGRRRYRYFGMGKKLAMFCLTLMGHKNAESNQCRAQKRTKGLMPEVSLSFHKKQII